MNLLKKLKQDEMEARLPPKVSSFLFAKAFHTPEKTKKQEPKTGSCFLLKRNLNPMPEWKLQYAPFCPGCGQAVRAHSLLPEPALSTQSPRWTICR